MVGQEFAAQVAKEKEAGLTVSVFIVNPSTTTLPVRMFSHITQTTDPLVASVSSVTVIFSVVLMVIVDRLYGLDRLLIGEGKKA